MISVKFGRHYFLLLQVDKSSSSLEIFMETFSLIFLAVSACFRQTNAYIFKKTGIMSIGLKLKSSTMSTECYRSGETDLCLQQ